MAKGRCLPLLKEASGSSYTTLPLLSHCWAWPCGHTWLSILLASALQSTSTAGEVENLLGTPHGPAVCVMSGLPASAVGLLFLSTSPLYQQIRRHRLSIRSFIRQSGLSCAVTSSRCCQHPWREPGASFTHAHIPWPS